MVYPHFLLIIVSGPTAVFHYMEVSLAHLSQLQTYPLIYAEQANEPKA